MDLGEMLDRPLTMPDLVIDGVHFGRGAASSTVQVNCWRIVNEELEKIEDESNNFYDEESYIIRWDNITNENRNSIFFYWKGAGAAKGYSPLPEEIEKENPPVERITQWAEPPAFLRLFSDNFVVHKGRHGSLSDQLHLYILRGEVEDEGHLFEVPSKRESLRSRTSFVLLNPKSDSVIIWHGAMSSSRSRGVIKKVAGNVFGGRIREMREECENVEFLKTLPVESEDYLVDISKEIVNYTPRLFYLNDITGDLLASEIECSHKSDFNTPFPFLQTHLYSAMQPAIFFLDDNDEIWIWEGWNRKGNDFNSKCFTIAIDYARRKSQLIGKLVKVQKVTAGFEPVTFINLFPTWSKREDIVELQKKDDLFPNEDFLIEVNPDGGTQQKE